MTSKSKTLKFYFIQATLLSSLVPFLFSIWLLWSILQNSNEKIKIANNELEQSYILQLIDTFHRVQSAAYMVGSSEELDQYFQSTIDNEDINRRQIENAILSAKNALCYKNTMWVIYGTRGKALIQIPAENYFPIHMPNIGKDIGVRMTSNKAQVEFIIPISYQLNPISKRLKSNLGFIYIVLPISEIKRQFPNLIQIDEVSSNLDVKDFKARFKLEQKKTNDLFFLYAYIFFILTLLLVAIYWGVKLFQKRIVDKLLLLKARVLNEMNYVDKVKIKNELDSLSKTFEFYLKYTAYLQSEIRKNSQLVAVGNLAHLIAHDVRKPFSNLSFFLQEIKICTQIKQVNKLIEEFEPIYFESKNYIEHLLNEIMDAGIAKVNINEEIKIEDLLVKSFLTIGNIRENKKIIIEYKFSHRSYLNIDELRILRVFVNIILNAIEAIPDEGKIWIYTKDTVLDSKHFVEILIGNTNSYIEKGNLQNIFEPFYTSQKERGSGLGLAIAQKIIKLHKGSIECFSDLNKGVEFVFVLPAGRETYSPDFSKMPKNISSEIGNSKNKKYLSEKKLVVVIDDDPLVGRSWQRHMFGIDFFAFLSPEDFFSYASKNPKFIENISILVSDFYFGKTSEYDFFRFVRSLREVYFNKIFLSSDVQLTDFKLLNEFNVIKIDKRPYTFKELIIIF